MVEKKSPNWAAGTQESHNLGLVCIERQSLD